MLKLTVFRVRPIIGAQPENLVVGAICYFVCSETQPDEESLAGEALARHGFQIEGVESKHAMREERLLECCKSAYDMYQVHGYGFELFGYQSENPPH